MFEGQILCFQKMVTSTKKGVKTSIESIIDTILFIAIKLVRNRQNRWYLLEKHSSFIFINKKWKFYFLTSKLSKGKTKISFEMKKKENENVKKYSFFQISQICFWLSFVKVKYFFFVRNCL